MSGRAARAAVRLAAAAGAAAALLACTAGATVPAAKTAPVGGAHSPPTQSLRRFEFSQPHMGTTYRLVLLAADEPTASRAADAAFARIADLDRRLTDYREDSELMQASRAAAEGPVALSPDVFRVLATAQQLAERTDGAFDVTVGALTRLWRRTRRIGEMPAARELAAARDASGYRLLSLDPDARTMRLARPGVRLDVGGIGKGYAADRALETLAAHGITRAMVVAGGDVAAADAPEGEKGWQVALAPLGDARPVERILLARAAVSTSGDAEQWVEIGGVRYSHMLDPRTGAPLTGRRSVTVVARDATTSDMLATAAGVLGPEDGARLVEETGGASLLFGLDTGSGARWITSRGWPAPAWID